MVLSRSDPLPKLLERVREAFGLATVAVMEQHATDIRDGTAAECIWLVEHPPLYTAGVSAKAEDLIAPDRFPVYPSARGGQYTYHGPGQRVGHGAEDGVPDGVPELVVEPLEVVQVDQQHP